MGERKKNRDTGGKSGKGEYWGIKKTLPWGDKSHREGMSQKKKKKKNGRGKGTGEKKRLQKRKMGIVR